MGLLYEKKRRGSKTLQGESFRMNPAYEYSKILKLNFNENRMKGGNLVKICTKDLTPISGLIYCQVFI